MKLPVPPAHSSFSHPVPASDFNSRTVLISNVILLIFKLVISLTRQIIDDRSRDLPSPANPRSPDLPSANLRSITRISTLQTWCVVAAAISLKKSVQNTVLITWSTSVGESSCHLNPDNSSVHFVSVSPPVIIINLPCSGR